MINRDEAERIAGEMTGAPSDDPEHVSFYRVHGRFHESRVGAVQEGRRE